MPSAEHPGPLTRLDLGNRRITLLGTAHVSRASAEQVGEQLDTGA